MSHKKKRNIIIGSLCGVLLLMIVGYAAFSSILKIKGTSTISSNWDIKITNIQSETLSGSATNTKDPEGIGTLEATFETNLVSPGDSMKYTITVENQGNINAKLDKITLSEPDNEYITFETSGLTEGDKLNAGSTADLIVTVTFKDVEINKMDESTSKLTVTLDYLQADGSSSETPGLASTINMKGVEVPVAEEGSGIDGLYLDTYESAVATFSSDPNINARYVYKGTNPDNYITFNDELWRILAVESDGTLKIMKKDSIGNRAIDSKGLRDSTSNGAGGTYCATTTSGCNAWGINDNFINENKTGTVLKDAELNTYLNNDYYSTLSNKAQTLIQIHMWSVGPVLKGNTDLEAQIASEKKNTWTGNIGLMSASDFIRANPNTEQCGNFNLSTSNKNICKTTNYIVPASGYLWTISPHTSDSGGLIHAEDSLNNRPAYTAFIGVAPALYLKSDITLSGSGTETDPYTIS